MKARRSGRLLPLLLSLLLVLLLVLAGVVTALVTSDPSSPYLEPIRRWSWPLLWVTLILLAAGTVWQYLIEHPDSGRPRWNAERPPYPGLEAFVQDDAEVFFGREAASAELCDRLHLNLPHRAHRFVAVIGPSGAGKSSLVQAGLLPRLARRRSRWMIVGPLVPEHQPIRSLARALAAALPGTTADELAATLSADPGALVRFVEQLRAAQGGRAASVLVVLDQAEELLTLTGEQERLDFLELLRTALRSDLKLWVVATMRSEFLDGMLQGGAADLFARPMVIGPVDRAALFEVIEKPAQRAGLTFAPGVVSELVNDTGSGDALPLLAYTLQALCHRAGSGGTVTLDDCRALGGVAGALARQADQISAELHTTHAEAPVLPTLLKFVTLDGSEPTRRRVPGGLLTEAEGRVVDAFIAARLLSSDHDGEGGAVVQVAHEALFRHWAPLRQAVEAGTDELRQRAKLERWSADWVSSGRRDAYLLRDERLQAAQQWGPRGDGAAELPQVREFLERSRRADHAAMERLSESVAKQALAAIDSDPEQAILLALAAVEECAPTPQAHRALLAAARASQVRRVLRGHENTVWSVAWSPDGQRLATASSDGTARIWDAVRGTEMTVLRGHQDWVGGVAWSPDGQHLSSTSSDHTARIWDAERGAELAVLRGHQGVVRSVGWSPDGRRLATCSRDRTARIWDAGSGAELAVLRGHQSELRSVGWSPDGRRLATSSRDRTARIWDADTGAELAVLRGHQDWVRGMHWSPDGRRLATGSNDRTVRIWDAGDGTQLTVLRGHQDGVWGVEWSPEGQRLATSSYDRTVRIWDPDTGTELVVLRGHQRAVLDVAWSPDGQQLATGSYDCTVRVWETPTDTHLALLRGHGNTVSSVAWSSDGQRLATGSFDHTARVWDATTHAEPLVLRGHSDAVWDVAWSPEGQPLATGSDDHTARIWNGDSGTEFAFLRGHRDSILGVAWSPDGQRLATASHDATARIWDVGRRAELIVIRGHSDPVRIVEWSPDGRCLATGSLDRTARIWDPVNGTELVVLRGHEDWVVGVAWSPDGQRLATGSLDRTARIWDADGGAEPTVLRGHQDAIWGVAWSPDGTRLATGSLDRTARIWDVGSGTELKVLRGHLNGIRGVAWSPDGTRLATGSDDRTARIWDVARTGSVGENLDALVAKARSRVFRALTDEERRSAMLPELGAAR